jgi:hypothetical protein
MLVARRRFKIFTPPGTLKMKNPKSESRNPKEARNPKLEPLWLRSGAASRPSRESCHAGIIGTSKLEPSDLGIRISFGPSDFGFRICPGFLRISDFELRI